MAKGMRALQGRRQELELDVKQARRTAGPFARALRRVSDHQQAIHPVPQRLYTGTRMAAMI
jgi:hypothetical protein